MPCTRTAVLGFGAMLLVAGISSAALAENTPPKVDTSGINMQPAYPSTALASQERGAVLLDVYVSDSGKVNRMRLRKSSGFDDLDNAAIGTVMGWRFRPAISNGETVSDWATVQIVFQPPGMVPASMSSPPAH